MSKQFNEEFIPNLDLKIGQNVKLIIGITGYISKILSREKIEVTAPVGGIDRGREVTIIAWTINIIEVDGKNIDWESQPGYYKKNKESEPIS